MVKKRIIREITVDTSLDGIPHMSESLVEEETEIEEVIPEGTEEEPTTEVEVVSKLVRVEPELPKKQYILCPHCDNKMYVQHGSAPESSWCDRCGKCFSINWHEEK